MLRKIPILREKDSSKSCLELNSLQKSNRAHTSISSRSRARGLERLSCSKYNVGKWENKLTLGFNAVGNINHMKKRFK